MAACFLTFVIVITLIISGGTSKSPRGQFPLENCFHDVDLLTLMETKYKSWESVYFFITQFEKGLSELSTRMDRSQLLRAQVFDHFSYHNVSTDVGNWSFEALQYEKSPYQDLSLANLQTKSNETGIVLKQKINFVERLFKGMSGVRPTAIHVGVIFLDGTNLTQEEIRKVPTILQQRHSSDVKIFVVVIGDTLLHLTDTIVLTIKTMHSYDNILMMAICKQCLRGGILFEHSVGTQLFSCYKLKISDQASWADSFRQCFPHYGQVAGIETAEELSFLHKYIYEFIKYNSKLSHAGSHNAQIYIGLIRDLSTYAKRFRWITRESWYLEERQHRPVIINHWLPGKPSGGNTYKNCGMWRFRIMGGSHRGDNGTTHTIFSDKDVIVEGWEDINCHSKIAHISLCEINLLRKVEDVYFINIKPASKESFEFALKKGDFVSYEENIVSISENMENGDFLQFLEQNNKDFPLFDCGEDAGKKRYIFFSLVCDSIDHCGNKRDEAFCVKQDRVCKSGQVLVHSDVKCDNVKDCTDGSDEDDCFYDYCESVRCCDGSCLPLQWINDGEFDCTVCMQNSSLMSDETSLENIYLPTDTNCALICNRNTCVNVSQLNDGNIDCTGPEGHLDETIGKLEPAETCKNRLEETIWAPKCGYIKDRYDGIIGCRDMSHLRDCENFQCREGYVKCPRSYCIPVHYLLDGKTDCPTGEDEEHFYIGPCTGNFACWGGKVCLHPDLVCDGHADCPHKDDELGCQVCPQGFRCTGGTVTVVDYNAPNLTSFKNCAINKRKKYLDFSGVNFQIFEAFFSYCGDAILNLNVLILSNCNIYTFDFILYETNSHRYLTVMVRKLDISFNMIREIFIHDDTKYAYENINYLNVSFNAHLVSIKNLQFSFLEIIDLSYTGLSYLDDSVFAGLPMLKHLNLSHTLISDFSRKYFPTSFTLQTLDLRGILAVDFHSFSFHDLTVSQNLYADHVEICCPQIRGPRTPSHACQAPVDAISSCFDLVKLPIQRVLLWVVAVLAILGNMAVIVYRVIWDRAVLKTGYGLFVTNLGVSDFIMGVYLFIIAGADYFFRDIYVLHEKMWKQSGLCKFAGFMATLSSETSTFFIFLITLDRFLVIKFPFGEKKLSKLHKVISIVLSWSMGVSLSLIPIVFNFDIYSKNAMCLGLPLTNIQGKGWEYSIAVFVILNFIMFLFIAYGQCAIFRAMSQNRIPKTTTSMSHSRRAEDITVAKQLSLVVLSDFLCWFPVGVMGLMSLGGHEVSNEVYAWTTVLLLPINSAINPVLYTIPALMTRWEKFKRGDQRTLPTAM